ncbi:MAG: hypothetical protein K6F59_01770 [Gammaproteobacteria bacterium]|nr:hypothetical protein [Gammaproteobacteria bacterium]
MKKSIKKQAVFPVLMLLVVTALALIGSSFAWFAMSNVAGVNMVEAQVERGTAGLMISQNGTSFQSDIELDSTASTFVLPKYFHQVSTADGVSFYQAEICGKTNAGVVTLIKSSLDETVKAGTSSDAHKLFGVATYNKNVSSVSTPTEVLFPSGSNEVTKTDVFGKESQDVTIESTASYMVFDLFFSVERSANLYLDFGTAMNIKNANKTAAETNEAMRVAFLQLQAVDNDTVVKTTFWNPSANAETTYNGLSAVEETTAFAPYTAVANKTTSVTCKHSGQLFGGTSFSANSDMDDFTSIASLTAGQVARVRVVVWLEGNVEECTAQVAELWAQLTLQFFAKETA